MSRVLRFTLWSVGILAVVLGATLFWVESQLRPEPLGARIKTILADAKIKGGIARVQASLDGKFSAEGIDLTLPDGTKIAAAAIKGEAQVISIIKGTYALRSLEIKTLDVDLSERKPATKTAAEAASAPKTILPPVVLGPYAVSGRIKLADGTLLRFSVRGDEFDTRGKADFRAGIAWPGFAVGKQMTDPRGEITLKADFRRPLGADGVGLDDLIADVGSLRLELAAKDASPIAAGSVGFVMDAASTAGKPGVHFTGTLSDSANRPAVKLSGDHLAGRTTVTAQLDVDPTRFGILSQQLPDVRLSGNANGELEGSRWQASADLKALWSDLSKFSKSLAKNSRSEWKLAANAQSTANGFAVNSLAITGNGVTIAIPQTLTWKGGLLPENANDATMTIAANDADLMALNPFLAAADIIATAGRWTGEASISFKDGKPAVTSIRTHSLRGVTLERGGKALMREIDAELPIKSEDGAISLAPFSLGCAAGNIATGSLTLRPGADGAWSAVANVNVGIVELASQPNWEDLPVDKLKGIRVSAQTTVERASGKAPVVSSADARIFRQGLNLLSLKLRQPLALDGSKPTGVLVEASARDLPLESLSAVVPGLKLTGDLKRADLVAGFSREGLFVRTEGAPLSFTRTSIIWTGKLWVKDCDLAASLDLVVGEKSTIIGFNQAELKNRSRILGSGDIKLGLGDAGTTLKLEGDLGALAEQPFAGPLNIVTGGQYRATADRSQTGEINVTLQVREVGLKQSEGRIKTAALAGKYVPAANGLSAEGSFKLQANNLSGGKFTLTQKTTGAKTDWQAVVAIDNVDVDDFLSLLPKSEEDISVNGAPPKPDRTPFWTNQSGSLQLTIGTARAYGISAEKVVVRADAEEKAIRLTQLSGKLADGNLSGRGQLAFQPSISNGPYSLSATVSLNQFEFGSVAQAFPSVKEFLQGRADATAGLTSLCGTPGELIGKLQIDTQLSSKGGRIRAFGDKSSSMSLSANKAGDIGETLGGLAMIAGALSKNQQQGEKIAKIGAAMTAAAKLQKAVADFQYSSATIKATRLASGTIKLESADIRNEVLHLTAKGGITVDPKTGFTDWPMLFSTQMRGAGEYAQYFQALGFGIGPSPTDGFTDGPGVNVSGSLNQVKTDLVEKLQQAVDNVRSAANARPDNPTQGTSGTKITPAGKIPATNTPAPKKSNPLGDLLKELGR
ncbi:MAG: hypothetical protein NTU71_06190 [Verrucomicrobia bacterium]|nr:hypothetical protein [Verrucomicrobiota bacterium]